MGYYNKTPKEVLESFSSSPEGITEKEALERLKKYGPNILKKKEAISAFKIVINQFKSFIIWVLAVVVILSFLLDKMTDAILVLVILVLNAILGFSQEYKAEKAIAALKKLSTPNAIVIREGVKKIIPSELLVPGDIIVLEEGNFVPADARIIETYNLKIDEAVLTGESVPVEKVSFIVNKEQVSEQKNMVFSSTMCVYGKAKAIVISTGMNTEIGKIAESIQQIKETKTPLIRKLDQLGKLISTGIILIALIIFGIGFLVSKEFIDMLFVSISIAVAAIPEGLPAVITITLALGVQKMAKSNVIIRRLPAVETLGSTSVICVDKTGTITKNEMTVKSIYANNMLIQVTGTGYQISGDFLYDGKKVNPESLKQLLQTSFSCNDADINSLQGDPTELALLVAAKKAGIHLKRYPRVQEIPFSSEKKYMATLNKIKERDIYFVKGAPENILDMCSYIEIDGRARWLGKKEKEQILEMNNFMASKALRVLGFAFSKTNKFENLIFVGLMGMIDPPREEVKKAVITCKNAGIKIVMITGDHKETAKAIAKQVGIEGKLITGDILDNISNEKLKELAEDISVYARVNPKHKVRIINALKANGHIVAMTGDGVNDAPALKKADIGIALESGTDVAKETSEMILKDNNFASIVKAVKEGRGIFDNIKKFIHYLLSCNLGELLTVFIAVILGFPLILLPAQILWINLVTDGLPALALGVEPVENDVMLKKPRKKNANVVNKKIGISILLNGILMTAGTLFLFGLYNSHYEIRYAQTMAFSGLVMFQMFNALNSRTDKSLFNISFFSNKKLLYAISISIILQLLVIYLWNDFFSVVRLDIIDWVYLIIVSSSILLFVEIRKYFASKHVEPN
ncbi:calcium-translocating P-type ATPase, SERCA-type [Candidatus Woesearchaeota archaeon]|nr:calcium-translocating P-type ATPase, SERCA-type [Candidatus Woesearchaeota archaeon]